VVVLNDDFNTFDHVAETLAEVIPGVTLAEGYRFADRIHTSGCAIV
jgi:ATP-dependent Clp protease adaptor protein ClpS